MTGTILEAILAWILKWIFRKKDPAVQTEEMLREQAIHEQKPAPSVDDSISGMR